MKDKTTNKKIHQVLILTENNRNLGCINRYKKAVRNHLKCAPPKGAPEGWPFGPLRKGNVTLHLMGWLC